MIFVIVGWSGIGAWLMITRDAGPEEQPTTLFIYNPL